VGASFSGVRISCASLDLGGGGSSRGFLLVDSGVLRPRGATCSRGVRGPPETPYLVRAPECGSVVAGTPRRDARRHGLRRACAPVSSSESVTRELRRQRLGREGFGEVCSRAGPSAHTVPSPHARGARGRATGNCHFLQTRPERANAASRKRKSPTLSDKTRGLQISFQEIANRIQKASKRTAASGTYASLQVFPPARSMGPPLGRGWEPP
jgi:hypothetical protein